MSRSNSGVFQCQCLTKKGQQCKHQALRGEKWCSQHFGGTKSPWGDFVPPKPPGGHRPPRGNLRFPPQTKIPILNSNPPKAPHILKFASFDMRNLTELIIYTGYENRLVAGNDTFGLDPFSWFTWDEENYSYLTNMTPLMTSGRIICPEEIDIDLAKTLNLDQEDTDFWREKKCYPSFNVETFPSSIDELFLKYSKKRGNPQIWRDRCATRRIQLIEELRKICYDNDLQEPFENGLCLRLNQCFTPFDITAWLTKQFYCSVFNPTGIYQIIYTETTEHRILAVKYDVA